MKFRRRRQINLERKVYRLRAKRKVFIRIKNRIKNRKRNKPKEQRKKSKFLPKAPKKVTIKLPKVFSFIRSPIEVLKVFEDLKRLAATVDEVQLDFRNVQEITSDVIPILVAKVYKYRKLVDISGNRPFEKQADQLLLESGFYKMVGLINYKSDTGLLAMHRRKVVDNEIAVQARILTAGKTLGDDNRKIQPLYRTLIECMANTRKHASQQSNFENWWLSVYHDQNSKRTFFTFFDTGIGIFKSTKIAGIAKLAMTFGLRSNYAVLLDILNGKIASSTGLTYRGKGLPKIYSDYKLGYLKSLYISANDTFADFDSGTNIALKNQLEGTFLYWEIWPD